MRLALIGFLFLVSATAPLLVFAWRSRRWGLPVRIFVDRADPRPADICSYWAEVARRLDERPERMRVVFDGRTEPPRRIELDLDDDQTLLIRVEGHRPRRLDVRGRWIADHPVPLDLRKVVLYVEPVDANRFRVMTRRPFAIPVAVYVACSLLATAGLVLLVPEILACVVGVSAGCACVGHLR